MGFSLAVAVLLGGQVVLLLGRLGLLGAAHKRTGALKNGAQRLGRVDRAILRLSLLHELGDLLAGVLVAAELDDLQEHRLAAGVAVQQLLDGVLGTCKAVLVKDALYLYLFGHLRHDRQVDDAVLVGVNAILRGLEVLGQRVEHAFVLIEEKLIQVLLCHLSIHPLQNATLGVCCSCERTDRCTHARNVCEAHDMVRLGSPFVSTG